VVDERHTEQPAGQASPQDEDMLVKTNPVLHDVHCPVNKTAVPPTTEAHPVMVFDVPTEF